MVPFDVHMGKHRASITFDSLVWFFVVTAAATVVGTLVYDKWVNPWLAQIPNLGLTPTAAALPPASTAQPLSNVVSIQTPRHAKT